MKVKDLMERDPEFKMRVEFYLKTEGESREQILEMSLQKFAKFMIMNVVKAAEDLENEMVKKDE